MTKAVWTGAVTAAAVLFLSSPVFAANTDSKTVTVNVQVNARAKLTLSATSVSFPNTDPDSGGGVMTAAPFTINVKARTGASSGVTLDVAAPNFTETGGATIPIGKLSYAASVATGFTATAAFSIASASAGSWTGSGNQQATHTYSMVNDWAYNIGAYSTTVTYTLTAP